MPIVVSDVHAEPDDAAGVEFPAVPASWCVGCSHLPTGGGTTACAEVHGCYRSGPEIWLG